MTRNALGSDNEASALSEKLLIDAIAAVAEPNSAIYLAGPLATGLEYYTRLAAGEESPVVRPGNERSMRAVAKQLREQSFTVIDPSVLTIPSWTPTRVGAFYIDAMRIFARELRFMPGWEYSSGATKEYVFAVKYCKKTSDLLGNQIAKSDAITLVKSAAQRLDELRIADHKLHLRCEAIMSAEAAISSSDSGVEAE